MAAEEQPIKTRVRVRESLQRYFLAGLLVFLPVAITLWFLGWVVELLDSVLDVLPKAFHPNSYLPIPVPRLGAVVTLVMILFLGFLTRGVATRRFLAVWEGVFAKIPVFRGIYTAVQKMVQTFLGPSNAQRQVVMIEYPRAGVFTVAFAMGRAWADLENKTNVQLVNVFVPTTPNPTSGFYLLVPSHEVTPLNMTIEEAFKLITSGGLITPDDKNKNGK
ncbi:MAG: DUF502 domain-containing protein [Deltaproteobacteria bacterium]|nr:DUF502 domain-containing protein [Deltaproteobacteria bacterium]MBI3066635.1 DUF502 domain-containing protein [Deltaproteobacteria bacterium]